MYNCAPSPEIVLLRNTYTDKKTQHIAISMSYANDDYQRTPAIDFAQRRLILCENQPGRFISQLAMSQRTGK